MGRKRRNRKKTSKEYPGGWREVLEKHPLSAGGYALRPSKDPFDDQVQRERERAKAKDWFAPRGKRHP